MKIAKVTDRFDITLDSYQITVSPLKYEHKLEILDCIKVSGGVEIADIKKQAFLSLKYSVKDVKGFLDYTDQEYKLTFDTHGNLSDDCTSEILEALSQIKVGESSILSPVFNFIVGNKKLVQGVSIKVNGKEIDLGNG
jgi:hypothetical protein